MKNPYNPEAAKWYPGTIAQYRAGRELGLDGFWVSTPATAEVFFFGSLEEVKEKAVRRLHIIDPVWVAKDEGKEAK